MKKYKPSKEFLLSMSLVVASFLIMQIVVIPEVVKSEMSALIIRGSSGLFGKSKVAPLVKSQNLESGILRVQYFEELDVKTKKMVVKQKEYFLDTANKTSIQLPSKNIDESLEGMYVTYDKQTGEIKLDTVAESNRKAKTGSERDVENIRTAVFLAEFENSVPVAAQAENFRRLFFADQNQAYLTKFFGEMTHGKVNMTGDVFGWFKFRGNGIDFLRPNWNYDYVCFLNADRIREMATHYQINLDDYQRVVVITNCADYGTIGGIYDWTYELGIPLVRTNSHHTRLDIGGLFGGYETFQEVVWNVAHELGHSFGLYHSNSLDCGERTIWINCTNLEYGDQFDAMGGWDGRIFNFTQQKNAGWIDDSNILQISEPGNYFINNLQTENGIVGAEISVPNIPYPIFAVEHRKPTGFDVNLPDQASGLLLYSRVGPHQDTLPTTTPTAAGWFNQWRLVDSHPTNLAISEDLRNDSILPGNIFHDPLFGVDIEITSITPEGINFTVDYDYENSTCGIQSPSGNIFLNPLCTANPPSLLAIQNFLATPISPSQIDLTWNNIPSDTDHLEIQKSSSSYFGSNLTVVSDTLSPNVTSYSDLNASAQDYYRIRAVNSSSGAVSAWAYGEAGAPSQILNLSGTVVSPSELNLTWENTETNGTSIHLGKVVGGSWQTVSNSILPNATSHTLTSNFYGNTFAVRVFNNATGLYSPWSNSVTIDP